MALASRATAVQPDPASSLDTNAITRPRRKRCIRHDEWLEELREPTRPYREQRARQLVAGQSRTDHHMTLPGWKGAFWRREPNPFTTARDDAPVIFPPGSQYAYSNPGIGMLGYAIAAALRVVDGPGPCALLVPASSASIWSRPGRPAGAG